MVGDELTASTADVDDPDGLPDPFAPAWQWYRTPAGGSETEIAGESSATYTVVEADLGAALTAKASWTDDGGFSNTLASTATAAVTPLPTVTVASATGGETVPEGTDAAFRLSRTGATTAALAVAVAVSETGAVLDDAASSPSSVTFDVGSDEATLALATNDDDTDDDDGTVTVTLGAGAGYTVGDPGAATVAVSDNDVPVDFVLAVPATVAEDAGPATVTVTATTAENAPPATAVEVQLAGVGGTSTGGSDYDAVSETASFQVSDFAPATVDGQPRYQAEWTHAVVIHDDDVVEGDETLVLEMSPTPAFLLIHTLHGGHDAVRATLTIVDNDAANVAPSFTSSTTFNPEENQTTVGTVAALDDDMDDAITDYALSGGADQALFAIDGTNGALMFLTAPDYEAPQDADTDNAYLVEVRATSGTGDRELTATRTITVTVTNADEGQSGTVSIDATAPMVGDELTASTAEVADPDGLPDPFAPTWKWYRTPSGGSETEIAGATSATYTVVEADLGAALTAKASWTDAGAFANTLASAATSAVTATLPELSVADGSATEGSPVTFTVTLSAAAAENVTVNWATSVETGDTAIAGTDFTAVPAATLTFMPGDTTATFTVQTTDDTTDESNETFTVTLSNPSSNATLAADPTATGTIVDGDAPNAAPTAADGTVTTDEDTAYAFEASDFGFADTDTGDGLASVRVVTLPGSGTLAVSGSAVSADQEVAASDLGGNLTFTPAADEHGSGYASFTFRVSDGSAESASAYTMTIDVTPVNDAPSAGTVTIDDTAPVVGDELTATAAGIADPDGLPAALLLSWQWYGTPAGGSETEIAGATAATYRVREDDAGAALTAKATYQDSDGFANTLASARTGAVGRSPVLSVGDASETEGQTVTFTVRLTAESGREVTVDWAASAESGDTAGSGDFTAVPAATLTFTAGQTEKTVTVSTTEDTADEYDETFTLTLSDATNATLAADATATGTIRDDDDPPGVRVTDASASEGEDVKFEVTLTAASGKTVNLSWELSVNNVPAEAADFASFPQDGVMTFGAGDTKKTIAVATAEDTTDEDDETFEVLILPDSSVDLLGSLTATGTIEDDDDPPTLGVANVSAIEGSDVTFTVRLLAASGREVTVDWAASAETGDTAGSGDFTAANGGLTFTAGQTEKMVTGEHDGGHDRRGERDLHAAAVERVERDTAGPGDGDGDDRRRRRRAGAERGERVGDRGPRGVVRGDADGGEHAAGDGGRGDRGGGRRHGGVRDGLHGGEDGADLHRRSDGEDGHGEHERGHDRRGERDLHAAAVERDQRDAGDEPDGAGHDRRRRPRAEPERGPRVGDRGPSRDLHGAADGGERQASDGGLGGIGGDRRHGGLGRLHGGVGDDADLQGRSDGEDGHGEHERGHDRRGERDLHAAAVERDPTRRWRRTRRRGARSTTTTPSRA